MEFPRDKTSFAFVLDNVLDEEDCAALLAAVNRKGFTPALVNCGRDMQMFEPEYRDGRRVIVDSPDLTQWLFDVIRNHLPMEMGQRRLVNLNERCRILCYTPGQFFAEHCDGQYRRPLDHPAAGDVSMITFQLYLNDVPDRHGGATTFFPHWDQRAVAVQPKAGRVLVFAQHLSHEGSIVRHGLKYTLRTEAMYTRRAPEEGKTSMVKQGVIEGVTGSEEEDDEEEEDKAEGGGGGGGASATLDAQGQTC